ncbi:putative SERINE-TYPE PROTEASE INHIBITOR-RELATED [Vibrio nigripulchritudo MADA3029]|uniref:PKD domain-containing protein n=1 Tax=Vibrio nigripulchritudo TaxID=28173 RepID=UPI0003B19077|nr:hypothetical protein [Vibrio nigripulchritudo]CCN45421.1 putative SERINE-TYPE PROTEASE INHIBITOR-RELATED [Vibrio nigripulchritudo MADA3020]CCN53697.1 putative SERINE-TYPE PROTEASE INHIBITOR-RELATED [Vibrio nigripulchritudo MADA3021]CCN58584.1 putative SERINE-TYPE PROTEASE INHIBITOR-RELATED [Vibrio nigripulchritudo MADA3029]
MLNALKVSASAILLILTGCGLDSEQVKKQEKPTVNAGADQQIVLPANSIILRGSAKSELSIYKIESLAWTQVSGPQQLSILNADTLTATAMNPNIAGTYVFQLLARDSGDRTNSDRVKVIVQENNASNPAIRFSSEYSIGKTQNRESFENQWQTVADQYSHRGQLDEQWQSMNKQYNEGATPAPTLEPYLVFYRKGSDGVIHFRNLNTVDLSSLKQQVESALFKLTDTPSITLDFSMSGEADEQVLLTLIEVLRGIQTAEIITPEESGLPNTQIRVQPNGIHQNLTFTGGKLADHLSHLFEYSELTLPNPTVQHEPTDDKSQIAFH